LAGLRGAGGRGDRADAGRPDMIQWKPGRRACKAPGCRVRYWQDNPRVKWCSDACCDAIALAALAKVRAAREREAKAKAKQDRAEHQKRKREVEPIGKLLKRVERSCNEYIHARDHGRPCISCGKHCDRMEAGHWKAVGRGGGSPARFHPDNIHLQCLPCNVHGGGGKHEGYLRALLTKIGTERVAAVERLHSSTVKWNRDALEQLGAWFRAEKRRLEKARASGIAAG